MLEKNAITKYQINEILSKRWSPRSFKIDKPIKREDLYAICEAGRWAPSCFNEQPWRYLVFDKFHNETQYKKAFECLGEWNQAWAYSAPVLIATISSDIFSKTGKENDWSKSDTGAATMSMLVEAQSRGIYSHQMGGFDAEKLKETFKIPENYTPISMLVLGYIEEADKLPEKYYKSEIEARSRREIGFNFFDSDWNEPIL